MGHFCPPGYGSGLVSRDTHLKLSLFVPLSISCLSLDVYLNISFIVSLFLSLFSHCLPVSLWFFVSLSLYLSFFCLSVSLCLFTFLSVCLSLSVSPLSHCLFVCLYLSVYSSLTVCLPFQMQKEPHRNGFPVVKMMATPLRANGVYWALSLTGIWAEYLEVAVRGV